MILRRYMTQQVASTTALVLGFLVVMMLGGRLIRYFGIAAEGNLDISLLFTIIGYNLPYFLELILPLAFFIALMLAMPFIIYQVWTFIRPALYEKEKNLAFPLLFGSIFLFYSGIAFAYFVALPSILHFFISVSPDTVAPMTDINSYLAFCLKLFLVFGVTFEIPIITLVLILVGLVTTKTLAEKRRFIIVGCFFVAMFMTPPDAISMIMLAVPMWMLFEIGLLFGKIIEKRKTKEA